MNTETKFTPPNISDYASGYENHMVGDAAFRDGTKYRFVILDSQIKHLYLYTGPDYSRNDFASRAPRKVQAVLDAALPLFPGSVAQMHKRHAQQDADTKAQNEAAIKKQKLEQAAPDMFEALKEAADLIYCCSRVNELNKEHFPHRSPEWVYDHPDTPRKLAMNNLLDALKKCENGKARAALAKASGRESEARP